ncbi:hypothetical protein HDE_05041 [Halotydeus destructor]|nr:hypothetical protein HDE_05041 [Halotydeus destructor]
MTKVLVLLILVSTLSLAAAKGPRRKEALDSGNYTRGAVGCVYDPDTLRYLPCKPGADTCCYLLSHNVCTPLSAAMAARATEYQDGTFKKGDTVCQYVDDSAPAEPWRIKLQREHGHEAMSGPALFRVSTDMKGAASLLVLLLGSSYVSGDSMEGYRLDELGEVFTNGTGCTAYPYWMEGEECKIERDSCCWDAHGFFCKPGTGRLGYEPGFMSRGVCVKYIPGEPVPLFLNATRKFDNATTVDDKEAKATRNYTRGDYGQGCVYPDMDRLHYSPCKPDADTCCYVKHVAYCMPLRADLAEKRNKDRGTHLKAGDHVCLQREDYRFFPHEPWMYVKIQEMRAHELPGKRRG